VDILVNGAGINSPTPFFDIPEDEFDRILTVNLKRRCAGVSDFWQAHVEKGSGSINQSRVGIGTYAVVTRVHLLGVEGGSS